MLILNGHWRKKESELDDERNNVAEIAILHIQRAYHNPTPTEAPKAARTKSGSMNTRQVGTY